jgi:hypothetical protein
MAIATTRKSDHTRLPSGVCLPCHPSSACVATEITFHLLGAAGILLGGLRAVDILVSLSGVGVLALRVVGVLVGGLRAVGALVGGLARSNSPKMLLNFDTKTGPSFLDSPNRHAGIFGDSRPVNL